MYDTGGHPYDAIRQCTANSCFSRSRYTGKERDTESGNDYFGARYYGSSMGRFLSPDWSVQVEPVPYARLDNPQTLNLYVYLRNNPLAGVDADGHCSAAEEAACEQASKVYSETGDAGAAARAGQQAQEQKAEVGYGETSGLVPERSANAPAQKRNPYDASTWDASSTAQLGLARQNIMDVSDRNDDVKRSKPSDPDNSIQKQAWDASMNAAGKSNGSLPGKFFFIRQAGVGKQRPSKKQGWGQGTPIHEYGPFRNVGGGDVPRGDRTYVDIYDK